MTQVKTKIAKKRVTFRLKTEPGSEVYIAGDFNNWDPSARQLKDKFDDGNFSATMLLNPGEYQYKFVINGHWSIDPDCEEWVPNNMGTLNSLIRI